MLFVRSLFDGGSSEPASNIGDLSKLKKNNGSSKPVSYFIGNNAWFVALFHAHERQLMLQLDTVHTFVIFWPRRL